MIDLIIPKFVPTNPHSMVENMELLARRKGVYGYLLPFFHEDVTVSGDDWPYAVSAFFDSHPKCGMVGFGGALGLGTNDLYKKPYKLTQLARVDFVSNMMDAEQHGRRVTVPTQVVVLDGFCQIIRRVAYEGVGGWQTVLDLGIEFHCYDTCMACLLAEKGWEVWMLPVPCHHYGGRTSTTPEYDAWLRSRGINGDSEIHEKAHRIIYDRFKNILPLRVK